VNTQYRTCGGVVAGQACNAPAHIASARPGAFPEHPGTNATTRGARPPPFPGEPGTRLRP